MTLRGASHHGTEHYPISKMDCGHWSRFVHTVVGEPATRCSACAADYERQLRLLRLHPPDDE